MGRKKELPVLEQVEITDIGAEGNAVARVENMVVFVPMLIPGDIVDIKLKRKRKNFAEGYPLKFHKYSPLRIEPACSHFSVCGGCKWQHLPYEQQLKFKERQVYDNLKRIGKIDIGERREVIGSGSEYFYRNKLEFTFSDKRWLTTEEITSGEKMEYRNGLGFHIPGLFDKVLDIEYCHLQPDPSNQIRIIVRKIAEENDLSFFDLREQKGLLRNLIVRNNLAGDVMVIVVFFYDDPEKRALLLNSLQSSVHGITSLMYVINPKKNDTINDLEVHRFAGNDHLTEEMDGLKFRISPKSFYQTNTKQAVRMYRIVKELAGLSGSETVYDLYSGTGTIACYLAKSAAKVIGIEYVEEAVQDAEKNAEINGLYNTAFFAGDIKDLLKPDFFNHHGKPDVIITDPPRAGMHADVVASIMNARPRRIVYVSCNPATQARDLNILSAEYSVDVVQPLDMFPQTHHIENIALLSLK